MVRRGMDPQKAREHGLDLLEANKIQPAPRMLLNFELSQALKNEPGAKPLGEIAQFAREMNRSASRQAPRLQATNQPAQKVAL